MDDEESLLVHSVEWVSRTEHGHGDGGNRDHQEDRAEKNSPGIAMDEGDEKRNDV